MIKTSKARPAKTPARASALCEDEDVADQADARKRAGVDQRKRTIASTMVYAGTGLRASERETTPDFAKPTRKRPAARKPATKVPATKKPASKSAARQPAEEQPPETVVEAAEPPRKRLRTHSQFILRIADTIAGQLDAIDAITRDPHRGEAGPGEAERHARTVAALARVSAELRKELEADRRRRADDNDSARDTGAPIDPDRPRDLDELRERLSRRLDIRLGDGSAVSVGDDAAGGDRLPQ